MSTQKLTSKKCQEHQEYWNPVNLEFDDEEVESFLSCYPKASDRLNFLCPKFEGACVSAKYKVLFERTRLDQNPEKLETIRRIVQSGAAARTKIAIQFKDLGVESESDRFNIALLFLTEKTYDTFNLGPILENFDLSPEHKKQLAFNVLEKIETTDYQDSLILLQELEGNFSQFDLNQNDVKAIQTRLEAWTSNDSLFEDRLVPYCSAEPFSDIEFCKTALSPRLAEAIRQNSVLSRFDLTSTTPIRKIEDKDLLSEAKNLVSNKNFHLTATDLYEIDGLHFWDWAYIAYTEKDNQVSRWDWAQVIIPPLYWVRDFLK